MVKRSAQGNGAGSGFELCECCGFGEDFNAHRRNDPKSFLSEDKKTGARVAPVFLDLEVFRTSLSLIFKETSIRAMSLGESFRSQRITPFDSKCRRGKLELLCYSL